MPDYLNDEKLTAARIALTVVELQDFSLSIIFDRLVEHCGPERLALVKRYLAVWLSNGDVQPSTDRLYEKLFAVLDERGFVVDEQARTRIVGQDH